MKNIIIEIDTNKIDDYKKFIKCKQLPYYKIEGNKIITDEESYNFVFGKNNKSSYKYENIDNYLFDYQYYLVNKALERKRYAVFADCGLGKTRVEILFAKTLNEKVLLLCPLSVMNDIIQEANTLNIPISNLRTEKWKEKLAIINFENMKAIDMRGVKGIILDESSILKNGDGVIRKYLTELASNIEYRLCASATPSPNEQSEYASHSVFLGYSSTLKEFYSQFFRKDGTNWILKAHAVDKFYENLVSWSCYIQKPSLLGFELGCELPFDPDYRLIETKDPYKIDDYSLFTSSITLQEANKIVFGKLRCDDTIERFNKSIDCIKDDQSIIWCSRNNEEHIYYKRLKEKAVLITGSTPIEKRVDLINDFRKGNIQYLISKPKILGFGVNIPQATSMLYSGYNYSFEEFYQAVRRSHRYGRHERLKVYIPQSDIEKPIWEILQSKLRTFEDDILKLQKLFFKDFQNRSNK